MRLLKEARSSGVGRNPWIRRYATSRNEQFATRSSMVYPRCLKMLFSPLMNVIIMAEQNQKNGLGVAGFVVALIGVILSWIPFINVFGVILCGVGLILSLIAVFKKPRGLAIAGLVISLIGIIILLTFFGTIIAAVIQSIINPITNNQSTNSF